MHPNLFLTFLPFFFFIQSANAVFKFSQALSLTEKAWQILFGHPWLPFSFNSALQLFLRLLNFAFNPPRFDFATCPFPLFGFLSPRLGFSTFSTALSGFASPPFAFLPCLRCPLGAASISATARSRHKTVRSFKFMMSVH